LDGTFEERKHFFERFDPGIEERSAIFCDLHVAEQERKCFLGILEGMIEEKRGLSF